jgi:FkbM family methyltransferase
MVELFYRTLKRLRNYRNPLTIARQRFFGAALIDVVDRRTGLRFRCRPGAEVMMAETLHTHIYDLEFAAIQEGDAVFDIGANHGFYSCWAALQGARVYAFEPDPRSFELLESNIRANRLQERVRAYPYAIASQTGEVNLFRTHKLGGGMNTIVPEFAEKAGADITSFARVKAITFTDAMALCDIGRLRVCKLDCEGSEFAILKSLENKTRDKVDAFVMEYHPEAYKLMDLLRLLLDWDGYHISKVGNFEIGNANLSVVRSDLILQWGGNCEAVADVAYSVKPKAIPDQSLSHRIA